MIFYLPLSRVGWIVYYRIIEHCSLRASTIRYLLNPCVHTDPLSDEDLFATDLRPTRRDAYDYLSPVAIDVALCSALART